MEQPNEEKYLINAFLQIRLDEKSLCVKCVAIYASKLVFWVNELEYLEVGSTSYCSDPSH